MSRAPDRKLRDCGVSVAAVARAAFGLRCWSRSSARQDFRRFAAERSKSRNAWRHNSGAACRYWPLPLRCLEKGSETTMKQLRIGDITIDAVIEREGPWRRAQDFFPAYDDAVFKHPLAGMEPEVFDKALGMIVITYQTFVVRTPRYTILVDT